MSLTRIRLLVLAGWTLLAGFVVGVAALGRIGDNVRFFQLAYVLGFVGYVALLWAVERCETKSDGSLLGQWRWWLIGCIALRTALVGVVPGDDTYRYLWEGRVQLEGFNPFEHAPNDPELAHLRDADWAKINHPEFPAIYPPVAQGEFLLAAALHPSVYTLKLLHVTWDALVVVVLASSLRRMGRRPHWAIAYALCPLVLSAFAIEGHVDSLMLLFVSLSVWAVLTRRLYWAATLLGLAISSKIVVAVMLPWFLWRHFRAAMLAVLIAALPYLPYQAGGLAGIENLVHFSETPTFFSLLATIGLTDLPGWARTMAAATLGVVVLALAWRCRCYTDFGAAALGVVLMLLPIVHYWYVSWVLLLMPFGMRLRWIATSWAMVVYFEALRHQTLSGQWHMPSWAPAVVWLAFAIGWGLEAIRNRDQRKRRNVKMK